MDANEKAAFVQSIYRLGLGRDPESVPALNGWAASIKDDGSNCWQVAASILGGPEGQSWRVYVAAVVSDLRARIATLKGLFS